MRSAVMVGVVGGMLGLLPAGARAQGMPVPGPPAAAPGRGLPSPGQSGSQVQARFQIAAMEAVLERAVQLGAMSLRAKVQQVAPDMLVVSGQPRARGFWLDGYGVFFDVDVPALRRSLAWSVRVLDQNDHTRAMTLRELKTLIASVNDTDERKRLEVVAQRLERTMPTMPESDGPDRPGAVNSQASPGPMTTAAHSPETDAILEDPGDAYTSEVRTALIDAMVEYSTPLPLKPTESLTIAARDQEGMRLQPSDPYDVTTVLLRVSGADLAEYRAGKIDKAEMRKRVEVKEY